MASPATRGTTPTATDKTVVGTTTVFGTVSFAIAWILGVAGIENRGVLLDFMNVGSVCSLPVLWLCYRGNNRLLPSNHKLKAGYL